jgi:hypothetical protein
MLQQNEVYRKYHLAQKVTELYIYRKEGAMLTLPEVDRTLLRILY